jgi:glycosyltransferase involved in cell wall biosynthesis
LEEYELLGVPSSEELLAAQGFSAAKVAQNDSELELATHVVAFSPFVRETLHRAGVSEAKIITALGGCDTTTFKYSFSRRRPEDPFRVAFIGNDSIRKGLIYLLRAASRFSSPAVIVEVFGKLTLPEEFMKGIRCEIVRHGSLARTELAAALRRCHAAALPSLWEGSALSIYESLAAGLPAIVTPNAGSAVTDGQDGFVVPIRDVERLEASLESLLDDERREAMSQSCARVAALRTWKAYGSELLRGLGLEAGPRLEQQSRR